MCQSIADGGKRCRCTTPEAAAKKRALRNEAQKRYLKRKRAAAADVLSPEVASEGIETSVATVPKKESKALTKARQRLELARRAGASQESIAVIEKRIAKLVPKVKKKVDAAPAMETPASEPAPAIMETAEHADTASPWRGLTEALEESRENAPSIEDAFETYLADTVEAVHHDAVAQLNAIIAASKAKQDEENAARLRAAMAEVEGKPNPFTGIEIPESTEPPISIDEAFAAHLAREAAEDAAYREQMARDASPVPRANPFAIRRKPIPEPKKNPFAGLAKNASAQTAEK